MLTEKQIKVIDASIEFAKRSKYTVNVSISPKKRNSMEIRVYDEPDIGICGVLKFYDDNIKFEDSPSQIQKQYKNFITESLKKWWK